MTGLLQELRIAVRSLARAKGLTFTVVVTLALGIGANAAIFTLVRGVLLKPLVNRDEDRLVYIRQSAQGIGVDNANFSVPEIRDLRGGVKTISDFGDFSTIGFTMIGLGEPREVRAGVVSGKFFEVMGLRPVMGRLLDNRDDGPNAAGAIVLTHRFWTTALKSDPAVLGKTVRLGERSGVVVGVLEPCVPYPAETEIIANIVTSPHHLSATMVEGRVHRMTELFGRLAPGATVESARAELRAVHGSIIRQHPEDYSAKSDFRIDAVLLRDQITSKAKTVLWVLLAASGLVFIIACSNVANLILARTVRREGDLAIRAALGASTGALRRTLLAESLLLCGAGAALGILLARPMVGVLARYASRFSVRALDLTLDSSMLWVGAGLAIVAAFLLAYIPHLPSATATAGRGTGLASGGLRVTGGTSRRLRAFAVVQIAASFLLLAGASMLLKTLIALQSSPTPLDTEHVLALNVPVVDYGQGQAQISALYKEMARRIKDIPGVNRVAVGVSVPWRDAASFGFGLEFTGDGHVRAPGEDNPRARIRIISPGYFSTLGLHLIAGRDFNDSDRRDGESVVIVTQSLAQRLFPNQDAVNRHVMWADPVIKFIGLSPRPRRIVGVVADLDDEHVVPGPMMTIYHPMDQQEMWGGRIFVNAGVDPYSLVQPVTRAIRGLAPDQPVERAATLADIRSEVLTPDRLNTVVFGGFAAVALAIAIVGVAGVLAFSVSGRTREFGIRLAVGSEPSHILKGVLGEGAVMAVVGVLAGLASGIALASFAARYFQDIKMPGVLPIVGAAVVLLISTLVASVMPAARAARVDVIQALRSE